MQLYPATFARDFSGRPTGMYAGPHQVSEGMGVLTVDPQWRSACQREGIDAAQRVLRDALERFIQGAGRKKFDELAGQLERTCQDIAVEKQLAQGYRSKATELADSYGDPAEVVQHQDAAAGSTAKVQALERLVPVLVRQLTQERELVQKTLRASLQAALADFQREHLGKAAQFEAEALAAFLPAYAKALHQRLVAQAPDGVMLDTACSSVVLDEPKRRDAEKPAPAPSIYTTFAGAAS